MYPSDDCWLLGAHEYCVMQQAESELDEQTSQDDQAENLMSGAEVLRLRRVSTS